MFDALVVWLGTDHERRAKLFGCLTFSFALVAVAGVLAAPSQPQVSVAENHPENNTLIGLQGYHHDGKAVEIAPNGDIVWEYDESDDVFDVESLSPNRIQLAVADEVPDQDCPPRFRNDGYPNCIRNSLRIVQKDTKETLWEYAWYDAELHEHELHDADHYTVTSEGGNGTAADGREDRWVVVDMGNDRVFAVNRQREVVWQWNATDTYDRPDDVGPEGDWTHMNDVDRLRPGAFQVSLRNFDTVVELHIENGSGPTDRDVTVHTVVGPNSYDERGEVLYEQHNPDRLADGHLLIADSERDRIVELNADNEVVWSFGGSATLDWPRDADRLSNGHTLVTDSYNDRVIEIDENGEIVWAIETNTLPYEADRLPGEGSTDRPTAAEANLSEETEESRIREQVYHAVAMSKYVLPTDVGEQVPWLALSVVSLLGATIEGVRWRWT